MRIIEKCEVLHACMLRMNNLLHFTWGSYEDVSKYVSTKASQGLSLKRISRKSIYHKEYLLFLQV